MNAVEDTFLNVRIVALEPANQRLDFLTLGTAATVVAHRTVFRKSTGALNKLQIIVIFPCDNGIFPNAIHRPNDFHSGKVVAVQLRRHGLNH